MQQLPWIFIIIARAQSSMRQCLRDYIFLPHNYVFALEKLRESLITSLKITVKKIVKSTLRFRKTIHQKIVFAINNFAKNDLHTP